MSADEPAFLTIAIAGLGLIGGSIALAVRERWPATRIVGIDHPSVLAHAMGSGAIDRAANSIADIGSADLVILAAPVSQNLELLRQIAVTAVATGSATRGTANHQTVPPASVVVTDVGSTKRNIVEAARSLPPGLCFVGGHPIGGAERGGFGFARPDLFTGRPWIFTPAADTDGSAVARLERLAVGLGARPARLEAADHDRLMAYVSHLPQLTASALMATVGRGGADGLRLAGRGLVDTTRLASSPASVWRDIAASNRDFIGDALDSLIARLTELRHDLQDGNALQQTFEDAGRWRAELLKGRE
jgi:prephenate dehydrogenase